MAQLSRKILRQRRHLRIRQRVSGTSDIPRMSVCVTAKNLYVQFIDDEAGRTLASASTTSTAMRKENVAANCAGAEIIGKQAAANAMAVGIKKVVFDRGGFKFHGRVKAIAEAAREQGLEF